MRETISNGLLSDPQCNSVNRSQIVKTVKVAQNDTAVCTIGLQSDGQHIAVSLWKNLAEDPIIRIGESIELTYCISEKTFYRRRDLLVGIGNIRVPF